MVRSLEGNNSGPVAWFINVVLFHVEGVQHVRAWASEELGLSKKLEVRTFVTAKLKSGNVSIGAVTYEVDAVNIHCRTGVPLLLTLVCKVIVRTQRGGR